MKLQALFCVSFFLGRHVEAEPLVFDERTKVTYRGIVSGSVELFQNIKFAHDTSGARRFAPPEPFTPPPDTIVDASSPGSACPQIQDAMPPFFSETKEISEDCLNLRIARPTGFNVTAESKLPVVVWLHGGGVVKGSAYDPHFDPDNLIKLSMNDGQPVIYVALHYRVHIFGFARLPALEHDKSLNVGMRDQRLGFQWVKDNIQVFGGDPERITAYGLSAGGTFISLQPMLYGRTEGLPFQQAWMMSGPPGTALNMTSDATTIHTTAVAETIGCGSLSDVKMLQCLRDAPMRDLLDIATKYAMTNHPPVGTFTFIPSIDNDLIPDRPSNLVRDGKFVKGIRMIFGWAQDDGDLNVGPGNLIQNEDDMASPLKAFAHALSAEQLSILFSLYPPSDFEQDVKNYEARKGPGDPTISVHYFRISRILRDVLFTCSSIDFGYQMVKQTQASLDPSFTGVRLYDLNQTVLKPLFQAGGMPYAGVVHGSDTNYIFNGVFPEGEIGLEDQAMSEAFTRSLISFAYTGNPISQSTKRKQFVEWPESYGKVSGNDAETLPSSFNIQVIGGPWGTGPAAIMDTADGEDTAGSDTTAQLGEDGAGLGDHLGLGKIQQVMSDFFNTGSMDSVASRMRRQQLQQQKLIQRCTYVKSLAETLGI